MKKINQREMLSLHVIGYTTLLYQASLVGWFGTTAFYLIGLSISMELPAGPILGHIVFSSLLLALFPGQTFWTIRVLDRYGQTRTIIGAPSDVECYYSENTS